MAREKENIKFEKREVEKIWEEVKIWKRGKHDHCMTKNKQKYVNRTH